ncbi:MAG: aminotransferase class V-fold PLP-dependent enzyme [Proteobacteria bacterium]|nr:aminotransferase class V-fold PLP-dependent enzyme [Pseudomonadota bacterium]
MKRIYLDNAATSFPKPVAVAERVASVITEIGGSPGRATHRMSIDAARVLFNAREAVASFIGALDSSRVVFTKNATEAINLALKGTLVAGDHVVTSAIEHNAMVNTLKRLEQGGVTVTRIAPDKEGLLDPAKVMEAVKKETRMVAITHASNVFGTVQPVGEIGAKCRERKILFMVDGAQSVGVLEVDVEAIGADLFAATGHKALYGPQGTGFLYVREGVEPKALIDGGTGGPDDTVEIPERLEAGTMNTPAVAGLRTGIEFILKEGPLKIRNTERALTARLLTGLQEIKGLKILGPLEADRRVSLVAFTLEGKSPDAIGQRLDEEYSLMVRCATHCAPDAHRHAGTFPDGAVRVSPGYFNTAEEIDLLIGAVKAIAAT